MTTFKAQPVYFVDLTQFSSHRIADLTVPRFVGEIVTLTQQGILNFKFQLPTALTKVETAIRYWKSDTENFEGNTFSNWSNGTGLLTVSVANDETQVPQEISLSFPINGKTVRFILPIQLQEELIRL